MSCERRDAEGNILQVDGGSTATYVYDASNQRVATTTNVNGVSTQQEFLFDPAGRRTSTWLEPSDSGNEGRIYWDGNQIAFRANDGTTYFENQDYIGTERIRTDYTGTPVALYQSLPSGDGYSANFTKSAADQDSLHFADLEQDNNNAGTPMSEHAQFRNYSFYQGRWLSPDPYDGSYAVADPQSFNRYAYVENNPLSYVDWLGLDPCPPDDPCPAPPPTPAPGPCDQNPLMCYGYYAGCTYYGICPYSPSGGNNGGGGGAGGGSGTQPKPTPKLATLSAPSKTGCPASGRAQMLGNGLLNVAIAAGKFAAAGAVEAGTSGIGTALALYGVYSGAGNLTTGLIQVVGALTPAPSEFQQAASLSSALGSLAGVTTLVVTNGNIGAASDAAKWENLGLFGFKGGQGSAFNPVSAAGTAVNAAKLAGVHIGC